MKTLLLSFFILFSTSAFANKPLVEAVKANELERAELILKAGADPDYVIKIKFHGEWYKTHMLSLALLKNFTDMARLLIAYGASLKHSLHEVAHMGSPEALEFLLQHGADPNYGSGWTDINAPALYYAVRYGRLDAVKILLNYNADIHGRDYLEMAYRYGHVDIVNYFEKELGLRLED